MNNISEKSISDCDRQLENIFFYFGLFLYENIEKGNTFYCFDSKDERLEKDAIRLLHNIRPFTISKKTCDNTYAKETAMEDIYAKLISNLRKREKLLTRLKTDICNYISSTSSQSDTAGIIDQASLFGPLKTTEFIITELIEKDSEVLKHLVDYRENTPRDMGKYAPKEQESFLKIMDEDIENIMQSASLIAKMTYEQLESIKCDYKEYFSLDSVLSTNHHLLKKIFQTIKEFVAA